jgi:hypothetical protein
LAKFWMAVSSADSTLDLTSTLKPGYHLSHIEALLAREKVAKVVPLGEA